jgi:hypothetical protein
MICFTPPLYAEQSSSWLDAVTVSGYVKLATSSPNRAPTTVELDDLSLLVPGKFNRRLNPFMEVETSIRSRFGKKAKAPALACRYPTALLKNAKNPNYIVGRDLPLPFRYV